MSYETRRAAIEGRMNTNWSDTDLVFEEIKYTPTEGTAWTKIWIIPDNSTQITIGGSGPGQRRSEIIQIDINVPAEEGTKVIRGYADTAIAIFENARFSSITVWGEHDIFRDRVEGWLKWSIRFNCWQDES